MLVVGSGVVGVLFVIAYAIAPSHPQAIVKAKVSPTTQLNLGLPGSSGHDLTIERLSASVAAVQKDNSQLRDNLDIEKKNAAKVGPETQSPETARELDAMRAELADLKLKQNKPPTLDDALPSGDMQPSQVFNAPVEVAAPEEPKLRLMVGEAIKNEVVEEVLAKKPTVFLPAGSNFEGILLNGMDAPTTAIAKQHPVPTAMRIKTDAIMPNRYRYDVRECFVMLSGFGELSTERVQLRTVVLSCIKTDGAVIEAKIEGYVVGEDGRLGMRGRLISKQGQLIAKSFVSGFFSGIAGGMAPLSVPQLNTTPGNTQQIQGPNINGMLTAGTAKGVADSGRMLSAFYLDMAKEMFPVVEIDANRRATIIIEKGVELNMVGEKK